MGFPPCIAQPLNLPPGIPVDTKALLSARSGNSAHVHVDENFVNYVCSAVQHGFELLESIGQHHRPSTSVRSFAAYKLLAWTTPYFCAPALPQDGPSIQLGYGYSALQNTVRPLDELSPARLAAFLSSGSQASSECWEVLVPSAPPLHPRVRNWDDVLFVLLATVSFQSSTKLDGLQLLLGLVRTCPWCHPLVLGGGLRSCSRTN